MILAFLRYTVATALFCGIVLAAVFSGDAGLKSSCESGSSCNIKENCSVGVSCEKE
jgi:hypothetical protein